MRIRAEQLSKWYGQVIGVNALDFDLGPGVTGFLGPNGGGKTTLLRLMTGQLKPSQGTVTLDGRPVWNAPEQMRRIGYCPEADAFWESLTGLEFVTALMRLSGYDSREAAERSERAVAEVEMTEARHRRIAGYSKGMRQRIKLAQAIAHEPQALFLDEPLNGMDPLGRRRTIELIRRLGEQGRTVVVSSHVLYEVEAMTDAIMLIHHGRLLAQGTIYEIRRLIDARPLQVSIRCDDVKGLTIPLLACEDVQSVQLDRERGQLTVETNQPEVFHRRLPEIVLEHGITVHSLWSPDEDLEAVFRYLVR